MFLHCEQVAVCDGPPPPRDRPAVFLARSAGDPQEGRRSAVEALERDIERRINRRTWGRLRRLRVEVAAGRLVVRGRSPTYYLKQLALAAAREVLPVIPLELAIEVVAAGPHPPGGEDPAERGEAGGRFLSPGGGSDDHARRGGTSHAE